MTTTTDVLAFLYQALEESNSPDCFGIVLRSSNVAQARTKITLAKKESGDPALDVLEARVSPFSPDEIWIVRKGKELPSEAQQFLSRASDLDVDDVIDGMLDQD